jgi:hypothetical protein
MNTHSHHGHFEFSGSERGRKDTFSWNGHSFSSWTLERGRSDTLSWNGHSLIMDTLSSLGWKEVRVTL